jgi:hypothetical protein
MNVFIDIVFLFVYIYVLIYFLLDLEKTDVITQKIIIFLGIFFFASLLSIIKFIRDQKIVDVNFSINSGLYIGLFAFIGHTILFDLNYMPKTRPIIENIKENIPGGLDMLLTLTIILSITFGKSVKYILTLEDQ